ncbi:MULTISPECIES: cysteine hydrolase family protein [Tepidibacillus]|nr:MULTISPECIES: isochorismatase family cysteine hydrolase [Tepidibacillus]GBF11507.1 nicotinamidase/pyrazinamidase [Tepidibacillus sp. HK-1]
MTNEALVIVDMSNDFVHDNGNLTAGKPAQEIVPYIMQTAEEFLTNGGTVVIAMDSHDENDPHFDLWPIHNVVGSWGHELYGDLKTWFKKNESHSNLLMIPKADYNAFFDTGLSEKLKERMIDKVHVVGVATDICVFLTTAGANSNKFKTVIHKRGVATFTKLGDVFINQAKALFHTEIIE